VSVTEDGPSTHEEAAAELPVLLSPWIVAYLGWPLAGFASMATYVLTEEAGMAIGALAVGAIWPDLVAALWNGWNDRDWRRRIGLPLYHLAAGLSYSVVLALFLLLAAGIASTLFPRISLFRTGRGDLFLIGVLIWAATAALFSLIAVGWCLFAGVTAWVDSRPLEQVVRAEWPPRLCTTNEASVPIYVALVAVIPVPFITATWLDDPGSWLVWAGWLGTLLLIGLSLKFFFTLKDRLVADDPTQCWPELIETDDLSTE